MIYGPKTIHGSTDLDVEVDKNGYVVAVWFRCMALPFKQVYADNNRADEMDSMYENRIKGEVQIIAIEVKD